MSNLADILPVTQKRRVLSSIFWHEFGRATQIWMECIWMILWVWSIFNARLNISYWLILLIFGCVMTFSYAFAVGIQRIKTSLINLRLLFLMWSLLSAWIVFKLILYPSQSVGIFSPFTLAYRYIMEKNDVPLQVWLAIVTGLIIIRAVKFAQFHVSSYSVRNSFQIGLIFLLFYGLFGINSRLPIPVIPVTVFLGLGLISLSSAKLAEMSRQRGGSRVNLRSVWLLLIIGITAGILFIGYLVTAFMHWQTAGITDISVYILAILTTLIIVPFAMVSLLLTILLIPFIRFLNQIGLFQLFKLDPGSLGIESNLQPILGLQRQLPIAPIFVMMILVILLLVIGYLVGRIRRKRLAAYNIDNWQIEKNNPDGVKKHGWLRGKILQAFDRLNYQRKIPNARKAWMAIRIRWIYVQFLDIMRQLGTPREKFQTPLEYLPLAVTTLPAYQKEMESITGAYLLVRYGEIPEDEKEAQKVLSDWQRINHAARLLIQKRKKQGQKDQER